MQPYFRDAVPGDLPAISAILRAASYDGEMLQPRQIEAALAEIEQTDHHYVLVAEYDRHIGAVLQFVAFPQLHRHGRCADIVALEVADAFRTTGIGTMLLEHAAERSRDLGCTRIQVRSGGTRTDDHPFWERAGFVHLERGYARALWPDHTGPFGRPLPRPTPLTSD